MTKIRSTDGSMIDDRRGRGGGSSGGGLGSILDSLGRGGGGGMGGGGGGGMGLPGGLKAGGGMMMILMVLAALFLPKLLGGGAAGLAGSPSSAGQATDNEKPCDEEAEQILCGAVNDVQAYWTEALPQFYGKDYVQTKTVFFTGSVDTQCGQATSQVGPFYCPVDQGVYFDLEFLEVLKQQLDIEASDLANQYIVAHEYGHHIQNVLGTSDQVNQAQRNDPSRANQYSVALELQADCYAGVWAGDAANRGLLESPDEINEALNAAAGVGDDRIQQKTQGRTDPESWTHGSAEQRQFWFIRGYNTLDPRQCNTFDEVL